MAFRKARPSELPWALMTGQRMPKRRAPPTSLASIRFLKALICPERSTAPSLVSREERNIPFSSWENIFPIPSVSFSTTLPVKPSATATSHPPRGSSLASTLPT